MNYSAEIAYDGTDYSGWQIQINAHTLQEEVETALSKILQERISIMGCGRTDAGVHARSFYLNFTTEQNLDEAFLYKVNHLLPNAIVFYHIWQVPDGFSSRFDAKSRTYKYYLHQQKNPFLNGFSLFNERNLDIVKMNEACQFLIGKKDFISFSKAKTEVNNFICDIENAHWAIENEHLVFTIKANRFLRNMVRAVVGTLLDIGEGKQLPEFMIEVINKQSRSAAGKSVAAHGLFLEIVDYTKEEWQIKA